MNKIAECLVGLAMAGASALTLATQASPSAAPAATEPPSSGTAMRSGPPALGKAEGMVMLDYQLIKVPGNESIDLMGFHVLNRMNDWLYLGVGAYAPLYGGDYGGFMAFDVTGHVQRRLSGNLFANAGIALGGGGGGKSVQQSKILSGTGGFVKAYVGLGYDFQDFSVGANVSRIKFTDSVIDNSQLNVFVQVPFSYTVGAYARSGERLSGSERTFDAANPSAPGETMLSFGLDNYRQIDPEGSNKGTINVADLQYAYFLTENSYWFAQVGVGYHGLPLYNQILGGFGYRARLAPGLNLYTQLAVGSGGYAPDTINTGPGLLLYPKVSAEYMLNKDFGLSLSAGYLFAPKGSSKNYTFGAALNYHIHSGERGTMAGGTSALLSGYRFHIFQQTEFNLERRDVSRSNLNMLSAQADSLVNDHLYIPIQVSVAYNAYLGFPGYGELLAGVGVQNKYRKDARLQLFGQVLVGTNVHGPILKTGLGLNYGLSDRLALYAQVGQTFGLEKKDKFRADQLGLGLSYRFSVPSR